MPGYRSKENENTDLKKYLHTMFIAALFKIATVWLKIMLLISLKIMLLYPTVYQL